MKNYVLDTNKYSLLLEGRGGNGTTEAMLNIGGIKMPDGNVVDGSEFVKVVNSAFAFFESHYPFEYKYISSSPVVYLLDNSFCNTMCVDSRGVVYINVGFLYYDAPNGLGMNPKNVFNILYHECMHTFLEHIPRTHAYNKTHNKNKLTWREMNIAADLEVNGMMVVDKICTDKFWRLLKGCYNQSVLGFPMESIASNYKDIIDSFKQKAINIPQTGMSGQNGNKGQNGQNDQQGQGSQNQNGQSGQNQQDNGNQNGQQAQNGQSGQQGQDGDQGQQGQGGDQGQSGQGSDGGQKSPHEFDDTPKAGGMGGDGGQEQGNGNTQQGNDSNGDGSDSNQNNSDNQGNGDGKGNNGDQNNSDNQGNGDGKGNVDNKNNSQDSNNGSDGNSDNNKGSNGNDSKSDGAGSGGGGKKSYNAEIKNVVNTSQRLVGEIIRQSEIDQNLRDSLKNSGFGDDVADEVSNNIENMPEISEDRLTNLRNNIIKNNPDSVLGRICKDIQISKEISKSVWEEIIKKFLEHNTLFAGKRNEISDRKKVRWGDRRTLAHDMMRPYHPKGSAAPQNINILIDTSGSINMELTLLFAQTIIESCNRLEYSGILLLPFADRVDESSAVYFKNSEAKYDKEAIMNRIIEMAVDNKAGGGTKIGPCVDCIMKYSKDEPKSVWIVFTDGEFTTARPLKRIVNASRRILFVVYNDNIKDKLNWQLYWCIDPELKQLSKCYIELNENIKY